MDYKAKYYRLLNTVKVLLEEENLLDARPIRKPTRLDYLGVPIGTILYFKFKPSEMITTVDNINQVNIRGEHMSITKAALKLCAEINKICPATYQCFSLTPGGESLWDKRIDMEAAGTYGGDTDG